MTVTTFSELELDESLLNAREQRLYTAIQRPFRLRLRGRDVLGSAPTGTGKQQPTCCLCCSTCSIFLVKIRPAAYFDPDAYP